jgi:hypothetical protein
VKANEEIAEEATVPPAAAAEGGLRRFSLSRGLIGTGMGL